MYIYACAHAYSFIYKKKKSSVCLFKFKVQIQHQPEEENLQFILQYNSIQQYYSVFHRTLIIIIFISLHVIKL